MTQKQSKIERATVPPDILALTSELDKLLTVEVHKLQPAKVPRRLYHYTNVGGLHGIIDGSRMQATNMRFMNDRMELQYGIQVVREVIAAETEKRPPHGPERAFLESCAEMVSYYDWLENADLDTRIDYYGICFCEDGDALPLWRSYAKEGVGYALGFSGSRLGRGRAFSDGEGILLKVLYNRKQQEARIRSTIRAYLRFIKAHAEKLRTWTREEVDRELTVTFNIAMSYFVVGFKHPSFASEKEWRFVRSVFGEELNQLAFRTKSGALVPYIHFEMAKSPTQPVAEIVHGPGAQQQTSAVGLYLFLAKRQLHEKIRIRRSAVPLSLPTE